jgi:hypothetical protein
MTRQPLLLLTLPIHIPNLNPKDIFCQKQTPDTIYHDQTSTAYTEHPFHYSQKIFGPIILLMLHIWKMLYKSKGFLFPHNIFIISDYACNFASEAVYNWWSIKVPLTCILFYASP